MAKAALPRTDRFLGTLYTQGSAAADSSEFREEEMWSMTEAEVNGDWDWERRAAPRRRSRDQVGGLSLAFEDPGCGTRIVQQQYAVSSPRPHQMPTSAPVNVPDWSKILRVDVDSLQGMVDHAFEPEETESEMVPPHQYLARSRNMASNSVFEGVGRTLKGRDMRRVRDAVWSQTGFDG
ncbi:uncharacterized protein LOC109809294 [Cajanus cajan]|uniref:Senescence regulator S40 n=1 Tax=Cajanus cajan TaxID=3821 RepID=A0A151STV9_CAJCA|nr:uncharacterized protein LOC109809294 [Cajanus cajan]KYP58233.1 hypothetical protein KK1_004527 [Cajanus cajan]